MKPPFGLGIGGRRRVPFVQQMTAGECGAACLAMTLGFHGKHVGVDELRPLLGNARDGSNAFLLLDAARAHGLRANGVQIEEISDLAYLEPGSILHWELHHFVVLEVFDGKEAVILDPAAGRRTVEAAKVRSSFTGVALQFERGEDFSERSRATSGPRRYLAHILGERRLLGWIIATSLMLQFFGLALPALTGALLDRVVPRGDGHLLLILCGAACIVVMFQSLATLIRSHALLHLGTLLDARITLEFFEHLMKLPFAFFQARTAGDLLLRLTSNGAVRETLSTAAVASLLDGAAVVTYTCVLLAAAPRVALLSIALAAGYGVLWLVTSGRKRALAFELVGKQSRAQSYQVELLTGVETLKVMGGEQRAVDLWSRLFVDVLNTSLRSGYLDARIDAVTGAYRLAAPLMVLVYGAHLTLLGEMSPGTMMATQALAMGILVPMGSLVVTGLQLQRLPSLIERLEDVLGTPIEQADRQIVSRGVTLRGGVELDRVHFRYAPAAPLAVEDATVRIEPGQFVAVVGPSGAGKSTLASLLVGLYRPDHGRILYDALDLSTLNFQEVRRQIGVVPQNVVLFSASVASNIAIGRPDASADAIERAARLACVHDEIMVMPLGYQTMLGERGASLSGGQRQRLALARALLADPAILLLDEATSALDASTESRVQESLAALKCTRIVIAHRLSTVARADMILVVENGKIVDRGRHEELVARGGAYERLVRAQLFAGAAPVPHRE